MRAEKFKRIIIVSGHTLFISAMIIFSICLVDPDILPNKVKLSTYSNGQVSAEAVLGAKSEFAGTLALNTDKSIYLAGETAYLQMAVLTEDGHTICDAQLKLKVKSAKLKVMELSTQDGTIQYSGQCQGDNVIAVPDYFAYYRTGETGVYQLKLIDLNRGGYEIEDSFEVRDAVPFEVERVGPTRIYPPATYQMILRIKVKENFAGRVKEYVPDSFVISDQFPTANFQIIPQDQNFTSAKVLEWQVDWRAGETHELHYNLKAPNSSPEVYFLGPLEFQG